MSLTLGKLAMNAGVSSPGSATWHRIADLPFTVGTNEAQYPTAVMKVAGRYLIYLAKYTPGVFHLYEYNPYLNTWTARQALSLSADTANTQPWLVTVGTKLYMFIGRPVGNNGGLTVYEWDQPTDDWNPASGSSVIFIPPTNADMRRIRGVYLPSEPGFIRLWFTSGTTWQYYRWTIGTTTFVQETSGLTSATSNYLAGVWADTINSPTYSLEQTFSSGLLVASFRRTWSATGPPSAQTRVDTPVSESGYAYVGTPELFTVRVGYEYDDNPSAGVANAVANSWISDTTAHAPALITMPSGLRVITPAGQTFWLGPNWTLAGTSTLPDQNSTSVPWDSYLPALGLSDTYAIPAFGLPTARYGQGLRLLTIVYAAGCIFTFGGEWFKDLFSFQGAVPWALRYGDITSAGGGLT